MGLDNYFYSHNIAPEGQVDFKSDRYAREFAYWRKHYKLHTWMHNLYKKKGGTSDDFNMNNVQLFKEDLDLLESDVRKRKLINGVWRDDIQYMEEQNFVHDDLVSIKEARNLLDEGHIVFYHSSY